MKKIGILILIVVILIGLKIMIGNNNNDENIKTESNEILEEEKYVEVLNDGTKLNTSSVLSNEKKLDGLVFKNIQLTNQNDQSILLADVTNTNAKATDTITVKVIILDENGSELGTIRGMVAPLKAGESTQFNTSTTIDYSNAYDFKIEKN